MERCRICVMPDTKPDHVFVDGVCPACRSAEETTDYLGEEALIELLEKHDGEVIVPSSGGKDSTYQALRLIELGAHPTVVTATTCHLTSMGRANIDNLSRLATTIEVTANRAVRAKLNRLGLEWVGDISWPEHASIFSTPFRLAAQTGIKLIMYGENPQRQYGGPAGTDSAQQLTERWVQEFGGFLGLRPTDFYGVAGITARDMADYETEYPDGVEAHFLGQYEPWNSHRNAKVSIDNGWQFPEIPPCTANWWRFENLDNAQTGIHDHIMYRKYGYGRGCAQISVDVRNGVVDREFALDWVREHDGLFPQTYMGIGMGEILDDIELPLKDFNNLLEAYTNWDLFDGEVNARPIPKC